MPTETALVDVLLPAPGTSITEGTVISWSRQVGERIEADETICEISSDKVDVDCPSPASGTVAAILVQANETVPVGTVLARIRPDGAESNDRSNGAASGGTADASTAGGSPSDASPAGGSEAGADGVGTDGVGRAPQSAEAEPPNRFISPVARRIAEERGVDLENLDGSGRGGRVTKQDVLAAASASGPEPLLHGESPYRPETAQPAPDIASPQPDTASSSAAPVPMGPVPIPGVDSGAPGDDPVSEPLSHMRRTIGAAMLRSQATAATCHTMVECDMTEVEALRREFGITALPLLAKVVVESLTEFPDLNATLEGDTISRYRAVHLGIAVSLGEDGLIVPVIRDAQNLSAMGLSEAIRDLAGRARTGRLTPDEVRGATFTITNPGAYGAVWATPVIDLPQVGILDFEAVIRRPVVITAEDGTESIGIRPMANLILGWDHRAVDGIYAARFLGAIKSRIVHLTATPRPEDPRS